ncbi:MAG: leucyl/phenylalanyl-tRNA--protein transferase [Pseudomonadota bacterium]|jgi:leucyl/phenylalanyl-tRNA--protein transferase
MAILAFPPLETADEDGLLAIGGDLEPASLLLAYRSGIFPWPINEGLLAWFAPPERAVVFLKDFHISRSLQRELKRGRFTTRVDTAFQQVISCCAEIQNRGEQDSTWIIPEMQEAYIKLHEIGIAHSFEAYLNNHLVGGIYGIQIGRFFAAESSFYRETGASKVAMLTLADYLKQEEIAWFDCQVLTPFSEGFGAVEISRNQYMQLLAEALAES